MWHRVLRTAGTPHPGRGHPASDLDLFRLEWALLIGTERFVEAVQRLGLEHGLTFRELPVRGR